MTAIWRIRRGTSSVDAACFTALGFSQLFVAVMAFLVDKTLFAHYVIAFGLTFLLIDQPGYSAKGNVEAFTPVSLKERARAAEPAGVAYLVFLHTRWSLSCRHAFSTFAELSGRYATERVIFAKLDLSDWPHMAAKLGVDLSPGSQKLPTIIMYENGAEVMRLPRKGSSELSKASIVRAFELDMRLATSKNRQGNSAAEDKKK